MKSCLIRRSLNQFGVDLEWDGVKVMCVAGRGRGYRQLLEEHEACDLLSATERMKEIEEAYHETCCAMA